MILQKEEVDARLRSEDNLFNRFRKLTEAPVVCLPNETEQKAPSVDDIVEGVEDKLNGAKGLSNAKSVLAMATARLKERLIEVDKPVDLARIAAEMNKIVNGEVDKTKNQQNNVVIYRPVINDVSLYPEVHVVE